MAVAPMFVLDLSTLLSRLKLSDAPAATATIQQALRDAKSWLYGRLGQSRVSAIQAMALVENPATSDEWTRDLAQNAETLVFRLRLMDVLPTLFMDGSGQAQQTWNQEPPFRNAGPSDLERLKRSLNAELEDMIARLLDEVEPGETAGIVAETLGPDHTSDLPGASVFPILRNPLTPPKTWV